MDGLAVGMKEGRTMVMVYILPKPIATATGTAKRQKERREGEEQANGPLLYTSTRYVAIDMTANAAVAEPVEIATFARW